MVTNIKEINQNQYKPMATLVVYKRTDENFHYGETLPMFFVSVHKILSSGAMGAGAPLTERFLRGILKEYRQSLSWLPETVIAQSPDVTIWWRPAGCAHLYFAEETGVISGRYPLPPMLFMLASGVLYNWALAENSRPTPGAAIYYSPFFNVYNDGHCCMGNIKNPRKNDISKWEAQFLGGTCTNELPPELKGVTAKSLWNDLIGEWIFPIDVLAPTGKTVAQIIGGRK